MNGSARCDSLPSDVAALLVAFTGGDVVPWGVERIDTLAGAPLAPVPGTWSLHGTTSNTRYINRQEVTVLAAVQQGLARPRTTPAALIPVRKTDPWWMRAEDDPA